MNAVVKLDRRTFLKAGGQGAAGLALAFHLPARLSALGQENGTSAGGKLNAFIHIGADDSVTFYIHKSEMGQGTVTSLSMLLAEELACDWGSIRTAFAPVDPAYGNQGVFGSNSIRSSWDPLRRAGAAAREMLVLAAADRWGVEPSTCRAENGAVIHGASNERLRYGTLAEAAAEQPVPEEPALKDPGQFALIGKSLKRLDTPAKVDGTAVFGFDVRVPEMRYASIERPPVLGAKVRGLDAARATATPGVVDVVQVSNGVAVVAEDTWTAMQARYALEIDWDEGADPTLDSEGIRAQLVDLASKPGAVAEERGDVAAGLAEGAKRIEAEYEVPYLAHAPMEPSCCTAHVREDGCDVWAPTQMQTQSRATAARITGLPPERVNIHTTLLGGGFGRRLAMDFVTDAVEVSKAIGKPVQVAWSREDDMRHSAYRPAAVSRFEGSVDAEGWPLAWFHRASCQPLFGGRGGIDRMAVDGASNVGYAFPHFKVEYNGAETPVPVTFWRSVGHSQNTFFVESFLDELAAAGGKDPLEVRRRLLPDDPRWVGVLNLAADRAGWGTPAPEGRARGIAAVHAFNSYVAEVAEVSVDGQGQVRIHRVVAAVDCGRVVNPAGVVQQAEGGIVFGLTAALKGRITIADGGVQQGNFNDYGLLRMDEMPAIEVHIVPSGARPGGMGEPAVPPAAPALCNAIFAATGKRIRRLPIQAEILV